MVAGLIDWRQAFPRQCPTLVVQSWIDNGVWSVLVPILVDFFQNRVMSVRWHRVTLSERPLSGSGPQGSTLGLLEYISQSNDNTEGIPPDMKYKWLDDLSTLEIVHVVFVEANDLLIQRHFENIAEWTEKSK